LIRKNRPGQWHSHRKNHRISTPGSAGRKGYNHAKTHKNGWKCHWSQDVPEYRNHILSSSYSIRHFSERHSQGQYNSSDGNPFTSIEETIHHSPQIHTFRQSNENTSQYGQAESFGNQKHRIVLLSQEI